MTYLGSFNGDVYGSNLSFPFKMYKKGIEIL